METEIQNDNETHSRSGKDKKGTYTSWLSLPFPTTVLDYNYHNSRDEKQRFHVLLLLDSIPATEFSAKCQNPKQLLMDLSPSSFTMCQKCSKCRNNNTKRLVTKYSLVSSVIPNHLELGA